MCTNQKCKNLSNEADLATAFGFAAVDQELKSSLVKTKDSDSICLTKSFLLDTQQPIGRMSKKSRSFSFSALFTAVLERGIPTSQASLFRDSTAIDEKKADRGA